MIQNYFKIAWRNLSRNKSYAFINISGLAVGIAASLLLFLVIHFETSFDSFHQKKDNIYRIVTASKTSHGINYESGVPIPTSKALRLDYPQIPVASIFKFASQITIGNDTRTAKKFDEDNVFFTESQFFDIFNFGWLAGDPKTALTEPRTVVLTQDAAEKYFGDWKNAIGKTILLQNTTHLKVTGILKNAPANTDFNLYVMISYPTIKNSQLGGSVDDWVSNFSHQYCFVVLPENMSASRFDADLDAFVKKHKPAAYAKNGMIAIPLSQMHYDARFGVFSGHTFSKELIRTLSLIGLLLIVIACVNFINLATAQAVNRSKEVGIRKVLGSGRKQLIFQYISETFIIVLCAVVLALGLARIALPYLNQLLDIRLDAAFLSDGAVQLFLCGVILGVTLLSGFYPAVVLSAYNPVTVLKNRIAAVSAKGISLRRGLVTLQFLIAQLLVIGTLVIVSQMDYFKNRSLGFDKDAIINVNIPVDSVSHARLKTLYDQLRQVPGIKDISYSFGSPSDDGNWHSDFKFDNAKIKTEFSANIKWADAEYFKLYGMQFVAGHAYEPGDTVREYVVNETLLKKLGIYNPQDAIGKYINLWDQKSKTARIVGVVKDFNVVSLVKPNEAVLMAPWKVVYQEINIKLQGGDIKPALASVEKLWNATFPDYVYEYQFLDKKIADFYKSQDELSVLYKIFAGIAIFISCLGLYGLVSFMAVQRTKEVGIRKTLGASVSDIVYLFSKEFTLLVVVAFAIAAPLGWYLMNNWLAGFAYRIHIGPGIFFMAIAASVVIALLTVGYKSVKAALANPVKSLRSE